MKEEKEKQEKKCSTATREAGDCITASGPVDLSPAVLVMEQSSTAKDSGKSSSGQVRLKAGGDRPVKKSLRSGDMDMLAGSIADKLLWIALPLALSSTLQQLFNAADIAVVGRFAGQEALAAVGANGPVINLFINLFVGLSVGTNAVLSRFIGLDDQKSLSRGVHTAVILSVICGFGIAFLGGLCARPILRMMAAPDNILPLAALYLVIYFAGMPFIMLYNFCAAILRSKGDTKRPLAALFLAGIINVLFNLFFVIVLHMSVAGVALATVLSNVFSSMLLVFWLCRESDGMKLILDRKHLKMDWNILGQFAAIGIPAGLQGVIFSLSNVVIQSAINQLGSLYIAGNTAALNYEYVAYYIYNAFNSAVLTFISQNFAAGNMKRCRQAALQAFMLAQVTGFVVNGIFILTRGSTLPVFTSEAEVMTIAQKRILILLSFEFFNGSIELLSGILRGYGKSLVPTITAIIGICGIRILIVTFMPATPYTYEILMFCYPISWVITSGALLIQYVRLQHQVTSQASARTVLAHS